VSQVGNPRRDAETVVLLIGDAFDKENEMRVLYSVEVLADSLQSTAVVSVMLNY
jgi:hypothetical protein